MKRQEPTQTTETRRVFCKECTHFQRDTSGPSFSAITGEYFMGVCGKGHSDGVKKVFANKPRECMDYRIKVTL